MGAQIWPLRRPRVARADLISPAGRSLPREPGSLEARIRPPLGKPSGPNWPPDRNLQGKSQLYNFINTFWKSQLSIWRRLIERPNVKAEPASGRGCLCAGHWRAAPVARRPGRAALT